MVTVRSSVHRRALLTHTYFFIYIICIYLSKARARWPQEDGMVQHFPTSDHFWQKADLPSIKSFGNLIFPWLRCGKRHPQANFIQHVSRKREGGGDTLQIAILGIAVSCDAWGEVLPNYFCFSHSSESNQPADKNTEGRNTLLTFRWMATRSQSVFVVV